MLDAENAHTNEPGSRWRSVCERRDTRAPAYYDFGMECRRHGWGDPALVSDGNELFRFRHGKFAFSRKYADFALVRTRGRIEGL